MNKTYRKTEVKMKRLTALRACFLTGVLSLMSLAYSATITSTETGGNWNAPLTWSQNQVPQASDNVVINGVVSVTSSATCASLTVSSGATLQNGGSLGWVALSVSGKISNDGTIRNNPSGNELWLELFGDLHNNGTWKPAQTYIVSQQNQTISQTKGKVFTGVIRKCGYEASTDTFSLIAASDIMINAKSFDGNGYKDGTYFWGKFDMRGYNLTLRGGTSFSKTIVTNVDTFSCLDSSAVSSITVEKAVTLGGRFTVTDSKVTFNGDVTVRDTVQNGGSLGWVTLKVIGRMVNNGTVRNNPGGNEVWLDVTGELMNHSVMDCKVYLRNGTEPSMISGTFGGDLYLSHSDGITEGEAIVGGSLKTEGRLDLSTGKKLVIPHGSILNISGTVAGSGTIDNRGTLIRTVKGLANNTTYTLPGQYCSIRTIDKGKADTLVITSVAGDYHPSKPSSVKRHWLLRGNKSLNSYVLTLQYDDALLNGSTESQLDVYLSKDKGSTWDIISSPVNLTRDQEKNSLVVGNVDNPVTEGLGDIIISSRTVAPQPSLGCALLGRDNIRVGPPNRYTFTYWNRSDYPVGPSIARLEGTGGISFKSAVFYDSTTGKERVVSVDSMIADDDPTVITIQTAPLGPRQVRSFDLIALAAPDALAKSSRRTIAPVILYGLGYLAVGAVWNYYQNYSLEVASEACYQSFFTSDTVAFKALVEKAVMEVEARYAERTMEVEVKEIAEGIAKSIFEQASSVALWPLEVLSAGKDCFVRTFIRMWNERNRCGAQTNLKKSLAAEQVLETQNGDWKQVCQYRPLTKVTSWDPNEKQGPRGVGTKGYFAGSDPITYTIFFENKKEATAPAYTVIIRDTLDAKVFDTSSVEFGRTSHPRVVKKHKKNVLYWEFDSLELPPNVNPPEGEGWVEFTVRLKPGLANGTEIRNHAVITFDVNKPITTNSTLNVIDKTAPVTTVTKASYVDSSHVKLNFSVVEKGSGLLTTSVFLSTDNAPFSLVAVAESLSTVVAIPKGKQHRFYAFSQDLVGNMEKGDAQIIEATKVSAGVKMPLSYDLRVNMLNGPVATAMISFAVPYRGQVSIRAFDLSGRQIVTIVDEVLKPGRYTMPWKLRGAGMRVIRMEGQGFKLSKEVLIVK